MFSEIQTPYVFLLNVRMIIYLAFTIWLPELHLSHLYSRQQRGREGKQQKEIGQLIQLSHSCFFAITYICISIRYLLVGKMIL